MWVASSPCGAPSPVAGLPTSQRGVAAEGVAQRNAVGVVVLDDFLHFYLLASVGGYCRRGVARLLRRPFSRQRFTHGTDRCVE